jgi:hypothetical protein
MTSTNIQDNLKEPVQSFQQLDANEQLGLLWFIYKDIGGSIDPKGGPDTAGFNIAQGLVDQIKQMPQEGQVQAQRSVLTGQEDNPITRAYADFNSSNRLAFWYLLGQAMDQNQAAQVPSDYQLSEQGQELRKAVQQLNFNDQITLLRDIVALTGSAKKEGAVY